VNHLEQLTAEWYEYSGYFVRRNIRVGKRPNGGYDCELDIVAFHPGAKHLIHIEPSMDAHTWTKREGRYEKKFAAGRKHIPNLFRGIEIPTEIEQVAIFGFGGRGPSPTVAGGKVMLVRDLLQEITANLRTKKIEREAVPEQFPLLRTVQLMCHHHNIFSL
jgi:hypothetical protein